MAVLERIDYKTIFTYFEEISGVPRGSRYNEKISNYLVEFAKKHQLEHYQDELGNVIIIKEAAPGYEHAPAVILQGHMDMVCEKESGIEHDFQTEGLKLRVIEGETPEGTYIEAEGTTLGGDDGIALAYALAILAGDYKHPRLEAVFTVDEEVGMDGAYALDVTPLKGSYMINLDSEAEGALLSSCAGGLKVDCALPVERISQEGLSVCLRIFGLKGGHSGEEINSNRTNADVLLARLLFELKKELDYNLISLKGGLKDNAIPRESSAKLQIRPEDWERLEALLAERILVYKEELSAADPEVSLQAERLAEETAEVLTPASAIKVLHQLLAAPNGVQSMSAHIPGLVESSLNLGVLKTEENQVNLTYSIRSSVSSLKASIADKVCFLTEFLGGEASIHGDYPAWEYKADSKLRELMIRIFTEQYGKAPQVKAIHAGLECGLISEKLPGIDIVALGPNMADIHTPEEKLYVESVKRVFDYVTAVLAQMNTL